MHTLYAFAQSGNSFKVAFLLRALDVPHELVLVDYMNGHTRQPDWRESINPMGEAPVLDIGHRKLVQSGAILDWLSRHHGRFDGHNEDERTDILAWLLFDNHKFTCWMAAYRFLRCFGPQAPDPAVLQFLRGRRDAALAIVEKHLRDRSHIVGNRPTIADFSMTGYLFYPAEELGFDVATAYPSIARWVERMKSVPGWADPYSVLPGERIAPKWAD